MPFDINWNQTSIRIDGKTYEPDNRGETIANVSVTPDYFATLAIPIVGGRGFTGADRPGTPLVAVVNEAMARRFWPNGSAVGRTFTLSFGATSFEVVGVTARRAPSQRRPVRRGSPMPWRGRLRSASWR